MSWGLVFSVVVIALLLFVVGRLAWRQHREAPLAHSIEDEAIVFSTAALIRIRSSSKLDGTGWGTLKGPAGAQLVIHVNGLQATIGRTGDGLLSGNFMRSSDATMWREQIGWGGTSVGERDCIRLHGFDGHGTRDWAVTPRGASVDDVWKALLDAGVTPSDPNQ